MVSRSPRFAIKPTETHFTFQNGCSLTGTAASKKKSDTDKAAGHVRSVVSVGMELDFHQTLYRQILRVKIVYRFHSVVPAATTSDLLSGKKDSRTI